MIHPYKMVLISCIGSILLLLGIFIYRYLYPKKSVNFLVILILLLILLSISVVRPGVYQSGDFTIHIYRSIEFYRSLIEGNIMPSWAGGLNATYGYPLFIFNYPLPYYLILLFHSVGFSYIFSLKLFLITSTILSGIFMYFCTKDIFKNSLAAFSASVFYSFAPYHLIDTNFKIVIGEILVFTFLPLLFLFVNKFIKTKNQLYFFLLALTYALLIMSHVVIAFFTAILLTIYSIFLTYQKKIKTHFIGVILSLILGAAASIYIWLTPFFLSKYTILQIITENLIISRSLQTLLYSPWRFGFLFQGPHGEIQEIIGYTQLFLIFFFFIGTIVIKKFTEYRQAIIFWLFVTIILIFLITPYANMLWKIIPYVGLAGNHRLLILVDFSVSILAGYFALIFLKKPKIVYLLLFITVGYTILNWGQRTVIPTIGDYQLIQNVPLSTYQGEGHFYANSKFRNPKDPWFKKIPNQHLEIISGAGEIRQIERNSTSHVYIVNAQTPVTLRENTLYFPGWEAKSNNKIISLSPDKNGVINLKLDKGLQLVTVSYNDLKIYTLLKVISIIGLIIILFGVFKSIKRFSSNN